MCVFRVYIVHTNIDTYMCACVLLLDWVSECVIKCVCECVIKCVCECVCVRVFTGHIYFYVILYLYIYYINLCDIVLDFCKGVQCNFGPVGNFTTCCIPSRVYKALDIRFHFYRFDRIVNS